MLFSILKLLYFPLKNLKSLYLYLVNFLIIKKNKIFYKSFPEINGKLIIQNSGICNLGYGLRFNCSVTSNLVGLYKPCTIAVLKGAELSIGDNSGFSGVSIYCTNKIVIGNNCNIGGNTSIWDTDFHPLNYLERRVTIKGAKTLPIKISDDVFIGANCIILKGVTIGGRVIIGAGSVVTKNIPADEIWAGNPAKFIRKVKE